MDSLILAIVGLLLSYFIIYTAIKDALQKKIERHLTTQTEYLKFLAKKAGMTSDENDRIQLTDAQYKKKNKEFQIKM